MHANANEVLFEIGDVFQPLIPDAFGDQLLGQSRVLQKVLVDPDDEDLLVIGPVEDSDLAAWRSLALIAPQKIMAQLLL